VSKLHELRDVKSLLDQEREDKKAGHRQGNYGRKFGFDA
jgi:hypothetical protein